MIANDLKRLVARLIVMLPVGLIAVGILAAVIHAASALITMRVVCESYDGPGFFALWFGAGRHIPPLDEQQTAIICSFYWLLKHTFIIAAVLGYGYFVVMPFGRRAVQWVWKWSGIEEIDDHAS